MLVVDLPFAYFGLVLDDDGYVAQAAPIAKYTVGWHWTKAADYFISRGATVELL